MELHLASTFIRVIADNAHRYPVATQQALLEGIFQVADECHDQLQRMPDRDHFENVAISLDLVKSIVNDSFKHAQLNDGLRFAGECFPTELAVPPPIY